MKLAHHVKDHSEMLLAHKSFHKAGVTILNMTTLLYSYGSLWDSEATLEGFS